MKELTAKEQAFVAHYMANANLNAFEAARMAGTAKRRQAPSLTSC